MAASKVIAQQGRWRKTTTTVTRPWPMLSVQQALICDGRGIWLRSFAREPSSTAYSNRSTCFAACCASLQRGGPRRGPRAQGDGGQGAVGTARPGRAWLGGADKV